MKTLKCKSQIILLFTILFGVSLFGQNEGVSIKTTAGAPDPSAMLDIENTSKGLLIPRVSFTNITQGTPVSNPAQGLLVFNPGIGTIASGFYYWDTGWKKFNTGTTTQLWSIIPSSSNDIEYYNGNVRIGNASGSVSNGYDFNVASGTNSYSCLFESNGNLLRWGSADYNGEVGAGPGNILVQKASQGTCEDEGFGTNSYGTIRYVQLYEPGDYGFGVTSYGKCGMNSRGLTDVFVSSNDLILKSGTGNVELNAGDKVLITTTTLGSYAFLGSGAYWGAVSDVSLKENVTDESEALAKLLQLRPVTYNMIADPKEQKDFLHGLIAQEVEEIFPEFVSDVSIRDRSETGEPLDTYQVKKGVSYTAMISVLIKAIQEQQAEIENLKTRVTLLEQ